MVAQAAVPLAVIASQMGLSIPAVIEYFQGQNIDLSGYGSNDLVDLETLFPSSELDRVKKYKTYDESFYNTTPVVGDTSLEDIIVQSKKDDEPIEVGEDELEVMPSQEVTRGDEPDKKPPDWDPEPYWKPSWRDIAGHLMEKILDKQVKELEKNITEEVSFEEWAKNVKANKEISFRGEEGLEFLKRHRNNILNDRKEKGKNLDTIYGGETLRLNNINMPIDWLLENSKGQNNESRDLQTMPKSRAERINKLTKSIQEEGFDPENRIAVYITSGGRVVVTEGNQRLVAAKEAGMENIPSTVAYVLGSENKNIVSKTKLSIEDLFELTKNIDHNIVDKQVTDSGLNFPKEKTDNNTRLHKLRLQKIIDGKADNYPGFPLNKRIVITGPDGSDLPPIAIGDITYQDWEDKITLDDTQIMEAANWYKKIFSSFEVMAGDDKNLRNTLVKAWLSGQINETPSSALNNVIYIYEQFKRGVPFDEVKGKGLPAPTNNIKSIIYGKEIEKGIGPKISDFIDAGLNINTRSWMGHNSSGGQPFVVDVHTARDTGLVDQTYLNHLEKLGYIIPENIKIDWSTGGGIPTTKYENRALFGQGLTKYLNDKEWMGKNDWKPSEIQAIGWMNLTNMYAEGNQSGDILKALNRNLRRISMEVEPGEGSPWQITYGEKYDKLDDDKKFTISEKVTAKAIEMINELTGVDFSGNVHGTGGWELYQNPSTVQQAYISKEAAKDAAAQLGFLLNQTEVWVNTAKDLTKNPQHFALDIIEAGDTNLRDSNTLKSLFERIINNDPAKIFRGYQPIVVQGEPGIRIIIDKDAISQAIKEKRIKKADVLPYIQEFTKTGLNEAIKDLDFDVNTYISEVELEKLTNDWIKIKNGQSFINNFSKDTRTTTEGGDRTNIYNLAKQLTQFFAKLLQEESTAITDATKKITKKKLGGSIEIPKFYFGGFIDTRRA